MFSCFFSFLFQLSFFYSTCKLSAPSLAFFARYCKINVAVYYSSLCTSSCLLLLCCTLFTEAGFAFLFLQLLSVPPHYHSPPSLPSILISLSVIPLPLLTLGLLFPLLCVCPSFPLPYVTRQRTFLQSHLDLFSCHFEAKGEPNGPVENFSFSFFVSLHETEPDWMLIA